MRLDALEQEVVSLEAADGKLRRLMKKRTLFIKEE
jgi:hypothetical protein